MSESDSDDWIVGSVEPVAHHLNQQDSDSDGDWIGARGLALPRSISADADGAAQADTVALNVRGAKRARQQFAFGVGSRAREHKLVLALRQARLDQRSDCLAIAKSVSDAAIRTGTRIAFKFGDQRRTDIIVVKRGARVTTGHSENRPLLTESVVEIGFTNGSAVNVAQFYGINEKTVRRSRKLVAATVVTTQASLMKVFAYCPDPCPSVMGTYSISTISFDETLHRLSLNVDEVLNPEQQRSAWHVLVAIVGMRCGKILVDGPPRASSMRVVRPPIVVVNTGAPCVYHGLFRSTISKPYEDVCTTLDEAASQGNHMSMRNFTRDGASSNSKLTAHASRIHGSTLTSDKVCSLHTQKTIETSCVVADADGIKRTGRLYSFSLLLAMGGYFMRMLLAVQTVVELNLEMRSGPPPRDARAYGELVVEFILAHHEEHETSAQNKQRHRKNFGGKYKRFFRNNGQPYSRRFLYELLDLLNGRWWEDLLVHHCTGPQCCDNYNRAECVRKIVLAFRKSMLRGQPKNPASNKWDKLYPCCLWLSALAWVHNLLQRIYIQAFGALETQVLASATATLGGSIVDVHVTQNINWHAVAGSRMTQSRAMISCRQSQLWTMMMCIVLAPMHFFNKWLLGADSIHKVPHPASSLCDLVHMVYSPILIVRQYFSLLLTGRPPTLSLLFRRAGCDTFLQWIARHPRDAMLFRRLVRTALC